MSRKKLLATFLQWKQDKEKIILLLLLFSHLPESNDKLGLNNKYAQYGGYVRGRNVCV